MTNLDDAVEHIRQYVPTHLLDNNLDLQARLDDAMDLIEDRLGCELHEVFDDDDHGRATLFMIATALTVASVDHGQAPRDIRLALAMHMLEPFAKKAEVAL